MLSRVADAIYWMSRYVERAENVARFLQVTLQLTLDCPGADASQWGALIATSGDQDLYKERYGKDVTAEQVVRFLTSDRSYGNSIVGSLAAARENARSVREVISRDTWEALNEAWLLVKSVDPDPNDLSALDDYYQRVRRAAALVEGLTDATWSHDEPWHFARLGRMIERADKTSRILDVKYFILLPSTTYVGTAYDLVQWSALLTSASADQMFRQRFHTTTPRNVANFLVFDGAFPRSIRHCLHQAARSLAAIEGRQTDKPFTIDKVPSTPERILGRLLSELDYGHIQQVLDDGLHEYLDHLQTELNELSSAVHKAFIAPRS
jgi:uncharacterized alpha-E superfamily protein